MVLHRLLQLLFGHPQIGPKLISRLSETRPIRAAARATAYLYLKGKSHVEKIDFKDQVNKSPLDVERFKDNLRREFNKGWQEAKQRIQEEQRRKR